MEDRLVVNEKNYATDFLTSAFEPKMGKKIADKKHHVGDFLYHTEILSCGPCKFSSWHDNSYGSYWDLLTEDYRLRLKFLSAIYFYGNENLVFISCVSGLGKKALFPGHSYRRMVFN